MNGLSIITCNNIEYTINVVLNNKVSNFPPLIFGIPSGVVKIKNI